MKLHSKENPRKLHFLPQAFFIPNPYYQRMRLSLLENLTSWFRYDKIQHMYHPFKKCLRGFS